MPYSALSELYFIAAMFVLTLIISGVAVYAFLKTYGREKQAREEEKRQKAAQKKAETTETR